MIRLSLKNITRKKSRAFLIFVLSVVAAFNIFYQTAQKNSVQNSLKQLIGEAISGQYIIYDSEEKLNVLESQFSDLKLFSWNKQLDESLRQETDGILHMKMSLIRKTNSYPIPFTDDSFITSILIRSLITLSNSTNPCV